MGRARQVVVLSHSKPFLCALWDGADAREAVKALIVANEYLESEVCDLMQAVSHAYGRGRLEGGLQPGLREGLRPAAR
jgi:hypothetical protein